MTEKKTRIPSSEIVKVSKPEKLYEKAREYLFFQIYIASEFIYDNYGLDTLNKFNKFQQEAFFKLKMSAFYKLMEGIIKKLPKSLKIKEGAKMMIDQMQFLESPKNIFILEKTGEEAIFEVSQCTLRKNFNKLAKKSNKLDLIDKCCLWCIASSFIAEKYDLEYRIELTNNGCLNYLK
jgi:hypothetical protein